MGHAFNHCSLSLSAKGKEVAGRSKGNTSDHVRASFVMNIVLFLIVVLR